MVDAFTDFAISATVGQVVKGWDFPADFSSGLYIFTGLGRALYVGISQDPVNRIHQHLGFADAWSRYETSSPLRRSSIGNVVHVFLPESLDWRICFASALELAAYLDNHPVLGTRPHSPDYGIFEFAERYLIYDLMCPVNATHSRRDPSARAFWELVWEREGPPQKSAGDYLTW